MKTTLKRTLKEHGIQGFAQAIISPRLQDGLAYLIQGKCCLFPLFPLLSLSCVAGPVLVLVLCFDSGCVCVCLLRAGSGLGVLKHNTVVIGWPRTWQARGTEQFLEAVRVASSLHNAVIVPK